MGTAVLDIDDDQDIYENSQSESGESGESGESDDNDSQRSLSASPGPSDSDQELDYEARRAKQIAENAALLEALGLSAVTLAPSTLSSNTAKRKTLEPGIYGYRKQQSLKVVDFGTTSLPIQGRTQFVSAVLVPALARRTRRSVYPANYIGTMSRRHSGAVDGDLYELSSEEEWELNEKGTRRKRRNNLGIRHVGGKIYDSVNGTTCHQCRQKTLCPKIHCMAMLQNGSDCPFMFCKTCLLVRYGESFSGHRNWVCPKCRGICNCSICLRKIGAPTCSISLHQVQELGFESTQEMLQQQGFWNTRTTARMEPHRPGRTLHKRKHRNISEDTEEPPTLRKSKSVPVLKENSAPGAKRKRSISGDATKAKIVSKRSRSDNLAERLRDNLSRKLRRQSAPVKLCHKDSDAEASAEDEIVVVNRAVTAGIQPSGNANVDLEHSQNNGTDDSEAHVDEEDDSVVAKKIADAEHLRSLLSSTLSEIAEIKSRKSASPERKRKKRIPVKIKVKPTMKAQRAQTHDCVDVSSDSGIGSTEEIDSDVNHDFLSRAVRDPEAEAIRQRVRDVEYLQASGELDIALPLEHHIDDGIPAMTTPELTFEDLFQV